MERGLIYLSKKPAMEIVSLNCNKLKIINSIYHIIIYHIYHFRAYIMEGGLLQRGGLFHFFTQKGSLLERGII